MFKKKIYPGDKEDSDSFGDLFKLIGGILISFAIVEFIKSLDNISIFASPLLIFGMGYLVFMFGFFVKRRNKQQIVVSLKNLLFLTGLLLVLAILVWFNLSR